MQALSKYKQANGMHSLGAILPPASLQCRNPCKTTEARKLPQKLRHTCFPVASSQQEANDSDQIAISSVFDQSASHHLQLGEDLLQRVIELPGTRLSNMHSRAQGLSDWKGKLRKGILPKAVENGLAAPILQRELLQSLSRLEMPRFCRRYPALLDSLLKQLLQLVHDYEAQLSTEEDRFSQTPSPQDMGSNMSSLPRTDGQNQGNGAEMATSENSPSNSKQDTELQLKIDDVADSQGSEGGEPSQLPGTDHLESVASELVSKFEQEWKPVMENVKEAAETFDNLEGLIDGKHGFDKSRSVWKDAGWREIRELRKMLEDLKELTALVRSLGRSSGKGSLKRAPQQIWTSKGRTGVHRSPLRPEETRGLTRSGDISLMLPFETHLLAASRAATSNAPVPGEQPEKAWSPLRRLHMARRAERSLLSYERSGWMEDDPTRVTSFSEIRPSTEMGPIICCLDTSGSMGGARETVAKAVTLECMRGAYRQNRQCFLYAFGGPGEVQELKLELQPGALEKLLTFLRFSFGGGTDVDRPLEMSLERLQENEWKQADILMVTDGEIPAANDNILERLRAAKENLGLEVHGLLVGRQESDALKQLTTHLHVFKSWNTVKDRKRSLK